jgi:acetyl-CoA carboxylase carboxyltransferase component
MDIYKLRKNNKIIIIFFIFISITAINIISTVSSEETNSNYISENKTSKKEIISWEKNNNTYTIFPFNSNHFYSIKNYLKNNKKKIQFFEVKNGRAKFVLQNN